MSELEILMSAGMTRSDAERHLQRGAIVYEVSDYIDNFEEYASALDDESKTKLRDFLTASVDGSHIWDNDLTYVNGIAYYIEYCL